MTSEYIAPLNLKYIMINVFAGSPNIFMGIFLVGISILAGIFKMSGEVFLLMIALSGIILYGWFGEGFYILVLLVSGMIVFWILSKLVKN